MKSHSFEKTYGTSEHSVHRFTIGITEHDEYDDMMQLCDSDNLYFKLEGSTESIRGFLNGFMDSYCVPENRLGKTDDNWVYELNDGADEEIMNFRDQNVVVVNNQDGYAVFYLTPDPYAFSQGYRAAIKLGKDLRMGPYMQDYFEIVDWKHPGIEKFSAEQIAGDATTRIFLDDKTSHKFSVSVESTEPFNK